MLRLLKPLLASTMAASAVIGGAGFVIIAPAAGNSSDPSTTVAVDESTTATTTAPVDDSATVTLPVDDSTTTTTTAPVDDSATVTVPTPVVDPAPAPAPVPDPAPVSDPAPVPDAAPAAETATYAASVAGTVTLTRTGESLEIISVQTEDGWTSSIGNKGPGGEVEVTFSRGDRLVILRAKVKHDRFRVTVNDSLGHPRPAPAAAAPAPVTATYPASTAGRVTLRRTGNDLEIVAVLASDGWEYAARNKGLRQVEVRFLQGERVVDFEARVQQDQIRIWTDDHHQDGDGPRWTRDDRGMKEQHDGDRRDGDHEDGDHEDGDHHEG